MLYPILLFVIIGVYKLFFFVLTGDIPFDHCLNEENKNQYSLFVVVPALILSIHMCYKLFSIYYGDIPCSLPNATEGDVDFLINALSVGIQHFKQLQRGASVVNYHMYLLILFELEKIHKSLVTHQDINLAFENADGFVVKEFINSLEEPSRQRFNDLIG
jgi:hypothetical protein